MNRFMTLADGIAFERFCKVLLQEALPGFQAFGAPDAGIDGYHPDTQTVFQCYFPEGKPRKDKIIGDLRKVLSGAHRPKRWVLVTPKNGTETQKGWLRDSAAPYNIETEIWGETILEGLVLKQPAIMNEYFPTQLRMELRRLAKGKRPCVGDAEEWNRISAEEREEIHNAVEKLAEESARRKRRRTQPADYSREFGEFKAYFRLSNWQHLSASEMGKARVYLNNKLYARRNAESHSDSRARESAGIHAIAKKLGFSNSRLREELTRIAGSDSLRAMNDKEIKKVFKEFRRMQATAEVQRT